MSTSQTDSDMGFTPGVEVDDNGDRWVRVGPEMSIGVSGLVGSDRLYESDGDTVVAIVNWTELDDGTLVPQCHVQPGEPQPEELYGLTLINLALMECEGKFGPFIPRVRERQTYQVDDYVRGWSYWMIEEQLFVCPLTDQPEVPAFTSTDDVMSMIAWSSTVWMDYALWEDDPEEDARQTAHWRAERRVVARDVTGRIHELDQAFSEA